MSIFYAHEVQWPKEEVLASQENDNGLHLGFCRCELGALESFTHFEELFEENRFFFVGDTSISSAQDNGHKPDCEARS